MYGNNSWKSRSVGDPNHSEAAYLTRINPKFVCKRLGHKLVKKIFVDKKIGKQMRYKHCSRCKENFFNPTYDTLQWNDLSMGRVLSRLARIEAKLGLI